VPSGYEIKALRKDGTTVDIEVSATTTVYKGETVSLAYLRDITDRRQAEKDRLHREALQGALDMAGTICHELNQPIQIISGYADLLLMGTLEELKVREKLGIMKEQTRRMGVITKRLMSLKEYTTRDYLGIGRIIDTDKPSEEADHV
jgi:signal transduction histidine kinase